MQVGRNKMSKFLNKFNSNQLVIVIDFRMFGLKECTAVGFSLLKAMSQIENDLKFEAIWYRFDTNSAYGNFDQFSRAHFKLY